MPYEVTLNQWSGPLEKLLELIETQELTVSEVSMAKVTDDFLKYLAKFREGGATGEEKFRVDLRILADFIAVASRLIFLKSKNLLPGLPLSGEEEADIRELEERLRRYQAIRPALRHLHALWRASHRSYSRPYFLGRGGVAGQSVFYPGKDLDIAGMEGALAKIFDTVTAYAFETETIKEKIITLEEKISEVLARVKQEGDLRFERLSGEKPRAEMIVLFPAILHLAREQIVLLEQMENFSDIMVKKNGVVPR
jgi:segregation and condensation protein A